MNRVALFFASLLLICSMSGCCLLGGYGGYGAGYPGFGGYGGGPCGSCGGCNTGYNGAYAPGGPTAFAPAGATAFAPGYPQVAMEPLPTYYH